MKKIEIDEKNLTLGDALFIILITAIGFFFLAPLYLKAVDFYVKFWGGIN